MRESLSDQLARYLLGIIRNIAQLREGMAVAHALWDESLRARDRIFEPLVARRTSILRDASSPSTILTRLVDQVLQTERAVERYFWLTSISDHILSRSHHEDHHLFILTARRIHTTFAVPHRDRLVATRFIVHAVRPVA